MGSKRTPVAKAERTQRRYAGPDIPMRVIRRYVRRIAERFHPDKIILFGSFAYGAPHTDSDVDLMVIMPCRNQHDQSVKIRWEIPAPFPMDLLVRKPSEIEWRLKERESFTTEVVTRGRVLYEKDDSRVGAKGRRRLRRRRRVGQRTK